MSPAFLGRILTSTVDIAACASFSGIFGIAAHFFNANSWAWGCFGFLIPIFPMYWYYSRPSTMKKRLRMLKEFHEEGEEGLINQVEYREIRKKALAWWADRLFGGSEDGPTIET